MKVRESLADIHDVAPTDDNDNDSGTEVSGVVSPEDVKQPEQAKHGGVDSGTSFSSREVTPRAVETNVSEDEGEEEEESDEEYSDDEEESEESEEETGAVKGKTPFVLLKQLVGIMKLGGGAPKFNNLPVSQEVTLETTDETTNNINGVSEDVHHSNGIDSAIESNGVEETHNEIDDAPVKGNTSEDIN